MTLVFRVLTGISACVLIIMMSGGYYGFKKTQQVMQQQINRLQLSNLELAAMEIQEGDTHIKGDTEVIAQNSAISKALYLQINRGVNQQLNKSVSLYPSINYIMVVETNGDIFSASTRDKYKQLIAGEQLLGLNIRQNPLYIKPSTDRAITGPPEIDPYMKIIGLPSQQQKLTQWAIAPVKNRGEHVGWVVVNFAWQEFSSNILLRITRQLQQLGSPTLAIIITDEKNQILVSSDVSFQTEEFTPSESLLWQQKIIKTAGKNIKIILIDDRERVYEQIEQWKNMFLVIVFVTILLLIGALYLILHRTLLRRIGILYHGARELEKGNLSYQLPDIGEDELGTLGQAFNKMATTLENTFHLLERERNNLTEQVKERTTELEDANRLKSEFLANMSHELRTPMNSIIGFTNRVIKKSGDLLPERQLNNLHIVERNAQQLLILINELLDISKIEAGRMDIYVASFELAPLIQEVLLISQPMAEDKGLTLTVELPQTPIRLQSDQQKLRHILINLLSNAIKFTDQGGITLKVEAASMSHEREQISLQVIDSGIGISEQQLPHIFEAFRQADDRTTRQVGGTGLGLAISQRFAELLQGQLEVRSKPGRGSTFILTLPLKMEANYEIKSSQFSPIDEVSGQGSLILCIDDDPDVLELLRDVLADEGYRVTGATTGEEGLVKAKSLKPAVITLDILMLEKDGWQVLHELKEDLDTREIPVIMLTVVENQSWGYRLGAADYLVKPVDNSALLSSLKRLSGSRTVLVVDDDVNVQDLLKQQLEDEGLQVTTANNGRQALELITNTLPDLILLDLTMPEMDGFELLRQLEKDEAWIRIPVIVLTAKNLTVDEKRALDQRVLTVIQKDGLSSDRLMEAVKLQIHQLKLNR